MFLMMTTNEGGAFLRKTSAWRMSTTSASISASSRSQGKRRKMSPRVGLLQKPLRSVILRLAKMEMASYERAGTKRPESTCGTSD